MSTTDIQLGGAGMKAFKLAKDESVHIDRRATWVNKGVIKKASEVLTKHKEISEYIDKYPVTNTRKAHFITLVYWLKKFGKLTEAQTYSHRSIAEAKQYDEIRAKNLLLPSRATNLVTAKRMASLMHGLEQRNFSRLNEMYLTILRCSRSQPPLRSNIAEMKIAEMNQAMKNSEQDYLIRKLDGTGYYYWVFSKQSNKIKRIVVELTPKLNVFIQNSLERYPRSFLLCGSDPDEPMGIKAFATRIRTMLGPHAGVDQIRSSYVNNFINEDTSQEEISDLAEQMLTSSSELQRTYKKVKMSQATFQFTKLEQEYSSFAQSAFEPASESSKKTSSSSASLRSKTANSAESAPTPAYIPRVHKTTDEERATILKRKEYLAQYDKEKAAQAIARKLKHYTANKEEISKKRVIDAYKQHMRAGLPYTISNKSKLKYVITDEDLV